MFSSPFYHRSITKRDGMQAGVKAQANNFVRLREKETPNREPSPVPFLLFSEPFQQCFEVYRQWCLEFYVLPGAGMDEADGAGMKYLSLQ